MSIEEVNKELQCCHTRYDKHSKQFFIYDRCGEQMGTMTGDSDEDTEKIAGLTGSCISFADQELAVTVNASGK